MNFPFYPILNRIKKILGIGILVDGHPLQTNMMSDDELVDWLNHPDQAKLWKNIPNSAPENIPLSDKEKYLANVSGLNPDLLFMHDAIFAENQKVDDIPLVYNGIYPNDWWADVDLENIRGTPNNRVDRYLEESKNGNNDSPSETRLAKPKHRKKSR